MGSNAGAILALLASDTEQGAAFKARANAARDNLEQAIGRRATNRSNSDASVNIYDVIPDYEPLWASCPTGSHLVFSVEHHPRDGAKVLSLVLNNLEPELWNSGFSPQVQPYLTQHDSYLTPEGKTMRVFRVYDRSKSLSTRSDRLRFFRELRKRIESDLPRPSNGAQDPGIAIGFPSPNGFLQFPPPNAAGAVPGQIYVRVIAPESSQSGACSPLAAVLKQISPILPPTNDRDFGVQVSRTCSRALGGWLYAAFAVHYPDTRQPVNTVDLQKNIRSALGGGTASQELVVEAWQDDSNPYPVGPDEAMKSLVATVNLSEDALGTTAEVHGALTRDGQLVPNIRTLDAMPWPGRTASFGIRVGAQYDGAEKAREAGLLLAQRSLCLNPSIRHCTSVHINLL